MPHLFLFAAMLLVGAPALAIDPVNQTLFGVAIEGIDAVAYFSDGRPVKGSREHRYEWRGASWRFSSAENRERFVADPERFAPQYGGYCAYAVSQGGTAGIDPEAWAIVDERLYLNLNKDIQKIWQGDRDRFIADADRNWPGIANGK